MGIICTGATDIGRKRKSNQDSICLDHKRLFYVVADGMGGHRGGDIASQMSVQLLPDFIKKHQDIPPQQLLDESIQYVNDCIYRKSAEEPELQGMGTTISCLLFKNSHLYVGNVGDSRTYLFSNQRLFQLTRDHSLIQEKINMGVYTRQQAKEDKMKNVLVRTVGFEPEVDVDVFSYKICKNDIFLVCSDGLHGKVHDRTILEIVNHHLPDPTTATVDDAKSAVEALINKANENGGQDNISVIIAIAQE
jgi:serine/threonine protein phosphatase PrpC